MNIQKIKTWPMRRKIALGAVVLIILMAPAAYFITRIPGVSEAAWMDDSWGFRKAIQVTHTAVESNVYIGVSVESSDTTRFQTDCGDIRFTNQSGELLPYYIQSGCGSTASVHVNFNTFPAGQQTIYLYYGNPSADNGFNASDFATQASNYTVGALGTEEKANGPVAYWKFGEGYGTVTQDATPNNNDGTFGAGDSAPTWATEDLCKNGKCLQFDGSNDYLSIGSTVNGVQTVVLWVKPTTTTQSILTLNSTVSIGISAGVVVTTGFTSPTIYVNGLASTSIAANSWQQIEVTTGTAINGTNINIGKSNANYLNGFLDEVKIYNYARTAAQVKVDYNLGSAVLGASSDNNTALTNGLMGYWSLDEGTGSTANDGSGNTNTATLGSGNSAPLWVNGMYGNGLSFDGGNDSLQTSYNQSPGTGQFTFAAWIKIPSGNTEPGMLFTQYNSSNDPSFEIETHNEWRYLALTRDVTSGSPGIWSTDDYVIPTDTWTHVAVIYDGSSLNNDPLFYVNGINSPIVNDQNPTGSLSTTTENWYIASNRENSATLRGEIDEIRAYNRSLSPAEVRQLADWAPGPVGHWKLDEKSGTTYQDSSGIGTTLTAASSAPSWTVGKLSGGLDFEKDNEQYASTADNATLSITGDLTLSAWIKPESITAGTEYSIAGKNTSYLLTQYGDEIRMYIDSSDNYVVTTAANLAINNWYYVSASYLASSQTVDIYVNGIKQATSTTGTIPASIGDDSDSFYLGGVFQGGQVLSLQPNGVAGIDTHVRAGAADNNYATSNVLTISNLADRYLGMLKFDLSAIPANATINNATLSLWNFTTATNNRTFTLYSILAANSAWTETGATWNYAVATTTRWAGDTGGNGGSDAGCTVSGTDFNSTALGTFTYIANDPEVTEHQAALDTSQMEAMVEANYGILLQAPESAGGLQFVASDYLDADPYWPKLVVNYSISSDFFDGIIDDVKIYNYARTGKQIIQDMNAGHPAVGSPIASQIGWWKFDEGYGSTVTNYGYGGTAINGTLGAGNSSPTWSNDGKINKALSFDGSNDYLSIGSTINPVQTVTFWVKPGSTATSFIGLNSTAAVTSVAGNIVAVGFSSPTYYVNGVNTATIVADQWQHVAVVSVGTVNGIGISIGKSNSAFYNGLMDEVKIYSSALTAEEIKIDMNQGSALVLGSVSINTGNTASNMAASQEFCIPGDTTSCAGPVAQWNLDEGVGGTAYDTSGNNKHLYYDLSTPSIKPGKIGKSRDFDNTSGQTMKTTATISDPLSAFTVEAWLNLHEASAAGRDIQSFVVAGHATSPVFYFSAGYQNNKMVVHRGAWGSNGKVWDCSNAACTIPLFQWTHVAITVPDSNTVNYYVNGKLVQTVNPATVVWGAGAVGTTASNYHIGGASGWASTYLDGMLDQVRVFNYVRTPAQIAYDYNRGGPVGWWKFDECQGNIAYDMSGVGNTGLISIGAGGTNVSVGTCSSAAVNTAWGVGSSGKYSSSLSFGGVDDYVGIGGTITGARAMSFWVKPFSTTQKIAQLGASDSIELVSGTVTVTGFGTETVYVDGKPSTTVPDTNWHLITVVSSSDITANLIYLGRITTNYYNGQIDDARVYNFALTSSQVKNIFNEGAAVRFGN